MIGRLKPVSSTSLWDRVFGARGPAGVSALRRLKAVGVVLPILFIVMLEVVRSGILHESGVGSTGHILLTAVVVVAVVVFAFLMFHFIERAQQHVIRQNRELVAMNAVSTAVQGELGVDQIIDAALESVLASSGATEASVTVFAPEGAPPAVGGIQRRLVADRTAPAAGSGQLVDIPLSTGTSVVGRLRLHLSDGANRPDLLASSTLQNIGHQLACALQIGQLVADLKRRRREGRGLYSILLQISNQTPLEDTLAIVVKHTRDLLAGDEAYLWLSDPAARPVEPDGALWGVGALGDGSVCVFSAADAHHDGNPRRLVRGVRRSPELRESLSAPIRSPVGNLGDLWVGRRSEARFTERDRRYLATLCDLASIAITGARMREHEHHRAILEERERIAREMHDGLAQVLGVTHLRLRALGALPEVRAAPAIASEVTELADLSQEAYRDVREAILGLRETTRIDRALIESLRAYLDKYSHQCEVAAVLETDLDGDFALAPRSELQIIRVIQEALTNVRKHSGAGQATVHIGELDGTVTIVVEDDGRGFDLADALLGRDGFGLHTMRERMELIGGTLAIDSAPGRGTRVIAGCPRHGPAPSRTLEVTLAAG